MRFGRYTAIIMVELAKVEQLAQKAPTEDETPACRKQGAEVTYVY
jgi:hypothetical protein